MDVSDLLQIQLGYLGFALVWVLSQAMLLWTALLLYRALGRGKISLGNALYWLVLLGWVGLICATLGMVRQLTNAITDAMGRGNFNLLVLIVLGLIGLCLLVFLGVGIARRRISGRSLLWLLLLFATAAITAYMQGWSPIGRIHLVQYGLVGALSFLALRSLVPWPRLLSAALGLATAFGALDEVIQGFLSTRYYDIWDVLINAVAAGIGIGVVLVLRPRSGDIS